MKKMNKKSYEIEKKKISDEKAFQNSFPSNEQGYILVMATDKFDLLSVDDIGNQENLYEQWFKNALEIRMFNDTTEYKWFRSGIDKAFSYRKIEDQSPMNKMDYWDEYQYLDIDLKASKGMPDNMVRATGGGEYRLPHLNLGKDIDAATKEKKLKEEDVRIKIRNYLNYEEDTGQLFIYDWRIVGFIPPKDTKNDGGNENLSNIVGEQSEV